MLRISVVSLALALVAFPTEAGWRYAEWAMTSEELIEAGDDAVELLEEPKVTPSGRLILAKSRFSSGDFDFDVRFLFTGDDLLTGVSLTLRDPDKGISLYQALLASYGDPSREELKPLSEGDSHIAVWSDSSANNTIAYYAIADFVALEYSPLSATSDGF